MQYLDHRLSKILSDIRIEQARKHQNHKGIRHRRLGRLELSLIEEGERRAKSKPRAA